MRKVAAAVLALPVLAVIYLPVLARRSIAARAALLGTVGIVVAVAAFGLARPAPTTANPPSPPIQALPAAAFRSVATGVDLHTAIPIAFSEAMDPTSVAASLTIEPATAIELHWSDDRRTLTVAPATHWPAATYEVVTVQPGALAASGRPMAAVARATFVTRAAANGRIETTATTGDATSLRTAIRLSFDRVVTARALTAALRVTPAVRGSITVAAGGADASASQGRVLMFTPDLPLTPGTNYTVTLSGLADVDGAPVGSVAKLSFTTTAAPSVVRFRPTDGTTKVDRATALSVRFTAPMSHTTTRAAVSVTANGTAVAGTISFAEGNTVLVFKPAKALPASATVVLTVAATATSVHGVQLAAAASATIHTVAAPKPAAPRAPAPRTSRPTSTGSGGSGGAVGGGSWGAVETYYLRLMNCTRTGGWVTSTGSCSSPGGRNVAPLKLDAGISTRVSRPYAKKLAVNNLCTHFSGGTPGDRLRAAGYTSYRWAENLGCRSGNPYSAVLGSHLFFQSEKSYSGGHYVNLMNAAYDRVGIGVWVAGGRVRLVIDFYHPR
ncbi:MAG TPA: Ig-like domain-containing protein [Candidatus Limnocylindrales bacterium]